jgi:benzoate membrane transport protein
MTAPAFSMRPPPASAFSSAAVATVIGFGGTVALVVQAGQALGADALLELLETGRYRRDVY